MGGMVAMRRVVVMVRVVGDLAGVRLVAVVHGGVIGQIMNIAAGTTGFRFAGADNASISHLVVDGDRRRPSRGAPTDGGPQRVVAVTPARPQPGGVAVDPVERVDDAAVAGTMVVFGSAAGAVEIVLEPVDGAVVSGGVMV